jgi:hypothetical protein
MPQRTNHLPKRKEIEAVSFSPPAVFWAPMKHWLVGLRKNAEGLLVRPHFHTHVHAVQVEPEPVVLMKENPD